MTDELLEVLAHLVSAGTLTVLFGITGYVASGTFHPVLMALLLGVCAAALFLVKQSVADFPTKHPRVVVYGSTALALAAFVFAYTWEVA